MPIYTAHELHDPLSLSLSLYIYIYTSELGEGEEVTELNDVCGLVPFQIRVVRILFCV